MTAPASFTRNSADVQAMRLDSEDMVWAALAWLGAHGVAAVPALKPDPAVIIYGPGSRMVARLGDWLTLDERGAFSVERGDADGPEGHERRGAE